jgi:hypothetical protein
MCTSEHLGSQWGVGQDVGSYIVNLYMKHLLFLLSYTSFLGIRMADFPLIVCAKVKKIYE